jgi:undecaprenyl diphosphate synthase
MTTTPSQSKDAEAPAPQNLPRHLAIIMDGNGRWAKKRGWNRVRGHEEGAESVRVAVRTCRRLGIGWLTLYAFSEENWARPQAEVAALMKLLNRFLKKERAEMLERSIRLNTIGEVEKLPKATRELLQKTMADTAHGEEMVLSLALSYGGRQEITRAARLLAADAKAGRIDPAAIDEKALADRLFTADMPDPDLLIRTSGEQRTSNFLPWQLAYTEFYFTETLWPDFREAQLMDALNAYAGRQRRFGRTGEQLEAEANG